MKKEEIHLADWQRILFGVAPPEFLLETLIRAILIYSILLVVVRLLGKRMSGQLTITEMSVMVTVGAIISPSLEAPDRGILLAVVAMLCMMVFQRGLTWLEFRNKKFENISQGETTILIKDGILQLGNMADTKITRQQILAQLRAKGIYNIGEIKRLYIEACGAFSIYKLKEPKPGLSTLPPDDESVQAIQSCADDVVACTNCAKAVPAQQQNSLCPVCGEQVWTKAIQPVSELAS
ncbi:DUF421 domain-containing protein [Spirosoma soli]|uniref:DUF421 domain-containing protein n=1 Tax=Spirosoma soli TaxID=1770529 RepID=A0ABW5M2P3_9BACT